jgi:hypothetical protein
MLLRGAPWPWTTAYRYTIWRCRPAILMALANTILVVRLAQHLDSLVELRFGQHLIAPVVKRVSGSTARRLPVAAAFRRLLSRPIAMLSRLDLHYTDVHRVNTRPVCQRTVRLAARFMGTGTPVDHAGFQAGLQRQCAELRRTFCGTTNDRTTPRRTRSR